MILTPYDKTRAPALAKWKHPLNLTAGLAAGLLIYNTNAALFGLPHFWSLALTLNAAAIFTLLLYFSPRTDMAIGLALLAFSGFVGPIGLWIAVISGVIYLLTAYRPKERRKPHRRRPLQSPYCGLTPHPHASRTTP